MPTIFTEDGDFYEAAMDSNALARLKAVLLEVGRGRVSHALAAPLILQMDGTVGQAASSTGTLWPEVGKIYDDMTLVFGFRPASAPASAWKK
jgi:hypothetical protein